MRFSAPISISFYYESWSNIESSHSLSFQWLRLCFFYVFSPFFFFNRWKRCRCPDRCVYLSFVRPHIHLQCYTSLQCRRFRWSRLFVSRSFCISFSFLWWVEAFCVASIESFFHALLWVSRFQRRSSSSVIPLRRKAEVDVYACKFSMSAPVYTCGTLPRQHWYDFWCRSSPVAGKLSSGPNSFSFFSC